MPLGKKIANRLHVAVFIHNERKTIKEAKMNNRNRKTSHNVERVSQPAVWQLQKSGFGDNLGWSTDTAGDPRADLSQGCQEVAAPRLKRPGTGAA